MKIREGGGDKKVGRKEWGRGAWIREGSLDWQVVGWSGDKRGGS